MVVMTVVLGALGGNVGTQCGVQQGTFQIVGGEGIACQNGLHVAGLDDLGEGLPCLHVKGKGGAHDPHAVAAVGLFVLQQLHDLLIIPGKAGLAGAAFAEGKVQTGAFLAGKGVAVYINALTAVFLPTQQNGVALLEVAELHDVDDAVFPQHRHAVHADLFCQHPLAVDFEVLRVNAGGVEVLGRNAVPGRGSHSHVGRIHKTGLGKIGGQIGGHLERHNEDSFKTDFNFIILARQNEKVHPFLQKSAELSRFF